jgi:hypothetical protein
MGCITPQAAIVARTVDAVAERNAMRKEKKAGRKKQDARKRVAANESAAEPGEKRRQRRGSTSSTPSTERTPVEDVEGQTMKPEYTYELTAGMDKNFRRLGGLLASLVLNQA